MIQFPDLGSLSHNEKDALIRALWAQVQALTARVAELEARLGQSPKTPGNSGVPPSQGKKSNHRDKTKRKGPRPGSLGREGGGRARAEHPDQTVIARPACCACCQAALSAAFRRAIPCLDAEVGAILARLRRARVVCSDETSVRVTGRTCWNWVFQNAEVVIHVVRHSRGAGVVGEVMDGHRPVIGVSDLYGAQQGHATDWQVCLAHQLRDCQFAVEAGDAIVAPRMKALLLRAFVLAWRRRQLAESTRRQYRFRMERELNAVMALAPSNREGRPLRKRYGKVRHHLFTFLEHPEMSPDKNSSERELRPTAIYRKVTGDFRSG